MIGVIRRMILVVVAALVLSACGTPTSAQDALVVGDRSASREDLSLFSLAVGYFDSRAPLDLLSTADGRISGDLVRAGTSDAVLVLAYAQELENRGAGVEVPSDFDDSRLAQLMTAQNDALASGQSVIDIPEEIKAMDPSSPGYELFETFLATIDALNADPDLATEIRESESFSALLDDVELESRIGVWDPATGQVFAP